MPNNVDSVFANEAVQQTSAPPCSPRYSFNFSAPLQSATKRLVIKREKQKRKLKMTAMSEGSQLTGSRLIQSFAIGLINSLRQFKDMRIHAFS